MKKVVVNVDWNKNYAAVPANEAIAVVVAGETLDEIKELMEVSLRSHIEGMRADGEPIPEEFAGEFEIEYRLGVRALLNYTEGVVPRKALSQVTGINVQQLSHYASGWRNPRPDMRRRIVFGIQEIGNRLLSVSA